MSVRSCFLSFLCNTVKLAGWGKASTGWGGGAGDGAFQIQSLVLDDRALVDLGQPRIGGVGQESPIGPQLDASVRIFHHLDVTVDQAPMSLNEGSTITVR